ncbi:MAG: hypothetical protein H6512_14890 [Acidimicrobiia bacterium]|nr:hypothetical protein [Acidimicrobiia bacterium]
MRAADARIVAADVSDLPRDARLGGASDTASPGVDVAGDLDGSTPAVWTRRALQTGTSVPQMLPPPRLVGSAPNMSKHRPGKAQWNGPRPTPRRNRT